MYTITVKIAAVGTFYNDPLNPHPSGSGHIWYSLAENGVTTDSYGFSKKEDGDKYFGQGIIETKDDERYASTYYTGQIVISEEQYNTLKAFGSNPLLYGFDENNYNVLTNNCGTFTWEALNAAGLNPNHYTADIVPSNNADDVDAALYSYLLDSLTQWNTSIARRGNYDVIYGSKNGEVLKANSETDAIYGGAGDDAIYGSASLDKLYGGDDNDILSGGEGSDTLRGGEGDDILMGNDGYGTADTDADYLSGGDGFDTYIAGDQDTINDSDGKGLITFKDTDLTGVKTKMKDSELYEDKEGFTYEEKDGKLIITKDAESITIENWSEVVKTTDKTKVALGIKLSEGGDVEVSTGSNSALEVLEEMPIPVKLDRVVESGEEIVVQVGYYTNILQYIPVGNPYWIPVSRHYDRYSGTWYTSGGYMYQPTKTIVIGQEFHPYGEVTFSEGEQEKDFIYRWDDDAIDQGNRTNPMTPKLDETNSTYGASIKVTIDQSGTGTIIDDDPATRVDPVILDTNKDGFISTTPLANSTTYFDITGDGLRERVGWVSSQDALLVYDKNDNGRIDGIDEMFGNLTQSGFDELKQLIDSNHDNKIDRKDELFNQLQVWNDLNGDAKVQAGELRSLDEAGVKDIDLNLVETNIDINGNTLTEASKYTTETGAHELVADVQLATDTKDTTVDPDDIPQFSVDANTIALPHLKGSGQVYDSFIAYNVDPEFKAIAMAYASDLSKLQKNPDALIENWSGYTQYISQLRERYSMPEFNMNEADKKAWIADRFFGTDTFRSDIEAYYTTSLSKGIAPSKSLTNDSNATSKYDVLRDRSESSFAILSHYQDLFSNTHYDMDSGKFVIDDEVAFNSKIIHYFNADTNLVEDKLYLASVLEMQHSGLVFNRTGIAQNISNDITQELVKEIFAGKEVNFIAYGKTNIKDIVVGTTEADILNIGDTNAKIVLNTGDDKLIAGKGNNEYFYRQGDGHDVIQDGGGLDTLTFDEAITRGDVIIKLQRNSDLVIALKEEGKSFDELQNTITIVDYMKSSNRFEVIQFGDGETLRFKEVLAQYQASDANELLTLSAENDTINAGGGDDVIQSLGGNDKLIGGKGNDRLEGGDGNDTYVYSKGDGKDTIIDTSGHDTLQFTSEITADDLVAKYQGNDLLIGLKEVGKSFNELSDVITLKNYKNTQNTIEAIFLDGYQYVNLDSLLNAPTEEDDVLELGNNDDTIDLLGGNDTVHAGGGNDTLYGGVGNDLLQGDDGNDILVGGIGDDTLKGGRGNDTYIFNRGDGKDTIYDDFSYGFQDAQKENAGNDTLQLGEGIAAEDILYRYEGSDLIIALKEEGKSFEELGDVMVIKNYTNSNNKIENILLSDGSSVAIDSIKNGTNGDDTLDFKDSTEDMNLQGLGGFDFIHSGSGNDNIQGGGDPDTIYTGAGNDTLSGGNGDDFLAGGSGNDRYIFKRGDGNDVILDDNRPESINFGTHNIKINDLLAQMNAGVTAIEDAGVDTLEFGEGISREDISYSVSGNDLIVNVAGSGGGSIRIVNHLLSQNKIENIVLADGTVVDFFAATNLNDNLIFGNEATTINALGGDDIVASGNGNDTITGGTGADTLKGGNGDDTYIFNKGDGKDSIEDTLGVDILRFGSGISQDDVIVKLVGRDLFIALKEEGKSFEELSDVITIKNHTNPANKLENISFANGTIIDVAMIALGTEENDNFIFGSASTTINALGGDDIVVTDNGNDTITGGTGADTLKGENGDDTYIFNKGDGKDSIEDTLGVDTLSFGSGISKDDVIVQLIGRDLVIALKEEGKDFDELSDVVTIKDHTNIANKLENISFANGTIVDVSTIALGTQGNDNFIFGSASTTIDALSGDDIVATGNGNDTILGGAGNDTLKSGDGEDTLIGGLGNDTLIGGRENDTYIFNRGDGHDTIHDYVNGIDAWGGTISFDKNESTDKVIVNVTGSSLENNLRSMEREFYKIATHFSETDGFKADEIFIKLVGDELIIAKFESGKFENWSNKIIFKQTVSDNGVYSYEEVETQGSLDIEYLQDSLAFTTQAKNKEGETITSTLKFTQSLNAGNDTLKFGEGVSQNDIAFKFIGNDLILGLKEDGKTVDELSDTVTLKDYLNSNTTIEHIVFNDGSVFNFDTTPMPTEGDDYLVFGNKSTTINLLGGNDIAVTGSGEDTILGGSGNDRIESGAGADYLEGGLGNDTLSGGLGDDTYFFNRGDGHDTLSDDGGLDVLKFGSGITQSDLLFKQDGNDLWIALKDADKSFNALSDTILVKDWFSEKCNIESISLADGTSLSATQIATMVLDNQPDTLYSKHGAIMQGGFGDDTYVYKKDDFTVIVNDQFKNNEIAVNAGNDTLKFEDINRDKVTIGTKGDDLIIKIDAGHDTYTELKDYVVIRDWRDSNRGIETIVFGDGETLNIDKTATYPPLEFDENWITSRYYIYGSENNIIEGTDASEVIESGAGGDTINAKEGNDYLTGGLGNDIIDGGKGNDTYVFNVGDGLDTLIDEQGVDTIKFSSGITREQLQFEQVGNDLVIGIKENGKSFDELGDKITLVAWYNKESITYKIELLSFDSEDAFAIADFIIPLTEGDDIFDYGDENNTINALGGNDTIHIGGGNDKLYGNSGNDILYGEKGNDLLSGGSGNDTLYGGEGDDTYLFGRGDGKDTIIEDGFTDWGQAGKDTVSFKEGISSDDLIIVEQGDDLIVALREDGKSFEELSDVITLKKWALYDDVNSRDYSREYYTVEAFKFSDGTSWSMADIIAHIGTEQDDVIQGFNDSDTLNGGKGNDILNGHLGDDTYVFNRGDGQDTIYDYGRKGDDYSFYNAGNDTLQLGIGIGTDDFFVQKFEDSDDIVIYLLEDGKTFDELSDKVTIKDWFKTNNRIENLVLSDGTQIDLVAYLNAGPTEGNDKLVYGNSDDVIDALAGDDIIMAQGGNDYVDGNSGNDQLEGGEGTDTLIGGSGDDILYGGLDDDRLEGGEGSDTYLFNLGDGHDTISDYTATEGEIDRITFGTDINPVNLQFIRRDNDLNIIIDDNNSIKVENWFLGTNYKLEELAFMDGTVLSIDDVENKVIFYGDENDNVMVGTNNTEQGIYGFGGNDTITGNGGDELIDGGTGNDTYIFSRGSGKDSIVDSSGVDTIKFAPGITMNDLFIKKDGENLVIALYEDGKDFETFSDVMTMSQSDIEKIAFDDGSGLDIKDIVFEKVVTDEILELDGIADVYTGSLNDDTSSVAHQFTIKVNSLHVSSEKVKNVTITILNEETGEYKLSGNFDALAEGEKITVSFDYEVNYDSADNTLISGPKKATLTVTGAAETSGNHAPIVTSLVKETLVNTNTQDSQINPHIFALNNGAYIVAWISGNYYYGNENEGNVFLQAFNADGEKIGNERILPFTSIPQITLLQDGGYVATWESNGQDGSASGIYLQRFNAFGGNVGVEQHVNTYTDGHQSAPQITALQDGGYVVTWQSKYQDGSADGVCLQRFNVDGEKVGVEQQVNTYTDGYQSAPQITALQDGGYVVTWQSSEQDGSDYGVYLQRFNANGEKVGDEQQVNTYTDSSQSNPQITALQDGGYVVTWQSYEQDGSGYDVYLQRFNANGEKVGAEQQVNTYINSSQEYPQITALQDGGYVVTWQSYEQDGSGDGIYLQRFDAGGEKVGVEQQVNTYTQSNQRYPQISALSDGGYVITWTAYGQDGSGFDVYLQRFDADGEKVGEVPQTNFFYTGQTLSGNLDYIVDPDGDTLSYRAIVPENMSFSIDNTGHWEYYYGGSGEITITIDDGKGGTLNQTLAFVDSRPRPLVLDLNHNGLTSISLNDSIAYFDYDGDENKEHTAWMEKGDAQLVVDLNHDGKINDGSEIFGEYTKLPDGSLAKDGYEALAQYDTNGDRVIDNKDEAFGNLLLWNDANQNGKSEEGELVNIQLSNVTAIYLDRENGVTFEQIEEAGNIILNETTYKGLDGNGILRDLGFAYDATDTITNNDTLDQKHYGSLLSGEDGDDTYLYSLGDGKIVINDNGDGQDKIRFGEDIVPEQLLVKWDKSTGDLIIGVRQSIYDPSSITEVSDQIRIQNWFEESGSIENFKFANGQSLDKESLYDLLLSTKEERSLTARGLEENGSLEGGTYSDLLYGSSGDEALYGMAGNDYLKGLDGDDLLSGDEGSDTLVGGIGDDTLEGGTGDDLYIYNRGDGRDLIIDFLGKDTISFGEGIIKDDLTWEIVGTNLVLCLKEEGKSFTELTNTITIENWEQPEFGIEYVEFYDGTILSLDDLRNQAPILTDAAISIAMQDLRQSTGTINATDPDGDTLTYSITTQAEHGILSVDENGSWVYKANAGYIGNDSAVILVDDSNGGVVEQTLNFTLAVSAPSIATTDLTLDEDTSLENLLNVTNPIGGTLTYEILNATTHGTFTLNNDGSYSYNPLENYNGEDSVTIKVTNAYGLSTTQTICLDIASVNDAPTLNSDESNYTLNNIRVISDQILALDVDNDTLTYSVSSQATHGILSVDENGVWVYKADGSYNGDDSAVILVDDGKGGTVEQILHFNIQGYIYEGEDLVIDESNSSDKLVMNTVSKDDLSFGRNGNDFVITVSDTNTITLANYFTNPDAGIEKLVTSNGEITLTRENINVSKYGGYIALDANDHLIIGDDASNWLIGNAGNDILFGASGSDYISGGNGNDLMVGGESDDNLQGNSGDDIIYGDNGNDQIYAGEGNDTLIGGKGNDILFGDNGDDWINGGSGNDTLYAGNGNDTLSGGTGDDQINGSYGSDTYLFNIGDGNDTVVDTSAYGSSDTDKILFGAEITKENLQILRDNYDLVFKVGDHDSMRVKYWFSGNQQNTIEQIAFNDGTTLNTNDVNAFAISKGTEGNDWLFGINTLGDNFYGMGGNDSIYSYGGNDVLNGGTGNDFLEGGSGSDTYVFNKGDGKDTINEWASWNSSDVDSIKFGEGITSSDVSFILSGSDLLIQYSGNDTIKVANTYNNAASSPIERIELSNGSYLTNNDMNLIIQQMSAYAVDKGISLTANSDIQNNQALMQIVSSGWHNA